MNAADVITAVAALIGACAALYGVDTWRRQMVGTKRHNLAEETLSRFYEALGAIRDIRLTLLVDQHLLARNDLGEDLHDWIKSRHTERTASIAKLQASRFRFMAIFGKEHEPSFLEFDRVATQIRLLAGEIIELEDKGDDKTDVERHELLSTRARFNPKKNDDEFENRLVKAMKPIEATCQSELQRAVAFWDLWTLFSPTSSGAEQKGDDDARAHGR